jgi:hypothetical protein
MQRNIAKLLTKNNSPISIQEKNVKYSCVHTCILWLQRKQFKEKKNKNKEKNKNKATHIAKQS